MTGTRSLPLLLLLAACGAPATAAPSASAHWSYAGHGGAAHWGELSPAYAACGMGHEQSPVDLSGARPAVARGYQVDYRPLHPLERNNGHTIQVDVPAGSGLVVEGERLALLQYHFHAPSEHTVNGVHYPLELHLVHRGAHGLAVLGVLIREGAANPAYEPLLAHLPAGEGGQFAVAGEHHTESLLPASGLHGIYRYAGSLTTPPCSEGVAWHVLAEPVELSAEQIARFTAVFPMNSRPVQPLGARTLLQEPR